MYGRSLWYRTTHLGFYQRQRVILPASIDVSQRTKNCPARHPLQPFNDN